MYSIRGNSVYENTGSFVFRGVDLSGFALRRHLSPPHHGARRSFRESHCGQRRKSPERLRVRDTLAAKTLTFNDPQVAQVSASTNIQGFTISGSASATQSSTISAVGQSESTLSDLMTFTFNSNTGLNPGNVGVSLKFSVLLSTLSGDNSFDIGIAAGVDGNRSTFRNFPTSTFSQNDFGLTASTGVTQTLRFYSRLTNVTLVSGTTYTGKLDWGAEFNLRMAAGDQVNPNTSTIVYFPSSQTTATLRLTDFYLFAPAAALPSPTGSEPIRIPPSFTPTSRDGYNYAAVPEPSSVALFVTGLALVGRHRRRAASV